MPSQFTVGFVDAMRLLSRYEPEECRTFLSAGDEESYAQGFAAAIDHFEGRVTKELDTAHLLGLVEMYAGYFGQANWAHPEVGDVVYEATNELFSRHLC